MKCSIDNQDIIALLESRDNIEIIADIFIEYEERKGSIRPIKLEILQILNYTALEKYDKGEIKNGTK